MLGLRPACPQDFICSPTARLSGGTRRWKWPCGALPLFPPLPLACPPFQSSLGYHPPPFPEQERQAGVPSVQVFIRPGSGPLCSPGPLRDIKEQPTGGVPHLPNTHLVSGLGSPLGVSLEGRIQEFSPGFIGPSPVSSTLRQCVYDFHVTRGSIPPSRRVLCIYESSSVELMIEGLNRAAPPLIGWLLEPPGLKISCKNPEKKENWFILYLFLNASHNKHVVIIN